MLCELKGGRGETLVETLVSLLITSLALMMLAGIVAATVRVTETGDKLNDEINKRNELLEKRTGGENVETKSGTVTIAGLIDGGNTVTFYIANYGGEDVISYAP